MQFLTMTVPRKDFMLLNDEFLFLLRMSERLIGVLIAGMCVFLGYRLFMKLPEKTDSQGRIVLPGGISIWLSRVGPGAFFALFGTLVVGLSFKSAVEMKTHGSVATADASGASKQTENTQELRGLASTSTSGQEQRMAEARTQIFTMNHDLPRLLRPDLDRKDREIVEIACNYSKLQILRAVWLDRWGSFAEFEKWALDGAKRPPAETIREPAEIFLAGKDD